MKPLKQRTTMISNFLSILFLYAFIINANAMESIKIDAVASTPCTETDVHMLLSGQDQTSFLSHFAKDMRDIIANVTISAMQREEKEFEEFKCKWEENDAETILYYGLPLNNYKIDEWMLTMCNSPNSNAHLQPKYSRGETLLIRALRYKKNRIAAALLARGASPYLEDARALRPLYYAALTNNAEGIHLLLHAKVPVDDTSDSSKSTPLMATGIYSNIKAAAVLLQNGANPNMKNECGSTPLHTMYGYKLDPSFKEKITAQRIADYVALLISYGADVNAGGTCTPLHRTAYEGNIKVAKALLDHGADSNFLTPKDESPIIHAIKGCQPKMVKLLLEHGATIDKTNALKLIENIEQRGRAIEKLDGIKSEIKQIIEEHNAKQ